jgi:hypothetical protein
MTRRAATCCSSLLLFTSGFGKAQSIRAEIKAERSVVRSKEEVPMETALRNTGPKDQSIVVLACGYDGQWLPDNEAVDMLGVACLQNAQQVVKLKPGEAYAKQISLWLRLPPDFIGRQANNSTPAVLWFAETGKKVH